MPLGGAVIGKRMRRDISQKELARLAGMPASKLCRIERGYGADPGVYTLIKVARALDCTLGELLREAGIDAELTRPVAA